MSQDEAVERYHTFKRRSPGNLVEISKVDGPVTTRRF